MDKATTFVQRLGELIGKCLAVSLGVLVVVMIWALIAWLVRNAF